MSEHERGNPSRPLVGAGAILLSSDLQQVLLIKRRNPPAAGRWSFPGGLVRAGETVRQACQRELEEETGLCVELSGIAVVAERISWEPSGERELLSAGQRTYHYLILDFWGVAPEQALAMARSDAADARWVAVAELDSLPLTRGVAEAVRVALALARGEAQAVIMLEDPSA